MACQAETGTGVGQCGAARRSWGQRIASVVEFVMRANEVARQRRALLALDDRMLKDFGASRADAVQEGTRAWWDLPEQDS